MKRTEHVSTTVAAVIGLSVLCGSPIYAADSGKPDTPVAIEKTRDIKAVYQIKTDDWKKGVGSGLYYVEKLANAYAGMGLDDDAFQVSAVLHGAAGYWLLKDDAYRKETNKAEANPNTAMPPHHPGQFWFLKLIRPGRLIEEHPFTISSSPTGDPPMTSTIKASGNFTRTIGETRPGDQARIEGPFGRFSLLNYRAESVLFIGGGVGITPIISMLRYLRDTGDPRPAVLIYANKTQEDILFGEELAGMPEHVKVVHVLSSPESGWQGTEGYVTTELIQREAGNLLEKADVFWCEPPRCLPACFGS